MVGHLVFESLNLRPVAPPMYWPKLLFAIVRAVEVIEAVVAPAHNICCPVEPKNCCCY